MNRFLIVILLAAIVLVGIFGVSFEAKAETFGWDQIYNQTYPGVPSFHMNGQDGSFYADQATADKVCQLKGCDGATSYITDNYTSCGDNYYIRWTGSGWITFNACQSNLQLQTLFCNKSSIQVQTLNATNITNTSAVLNGNLVAVGAPSANVWLEWGRTASYDHETSHQTTSNAGAFSSQIADLFPGTIYHFRAVAQNNSGTVYGQDVAFTTTGPSPSAPQVQTLPATNVSSSQANLNGKLVDLGDSNYSNVWFQWGRTSSYEKETSHITKTDTNEFTSVIYGLASNTTYHFRAVSQNQFGTVYGDDMVFTTGIVVRQPQVQTLSASNILLHQAALNGNLYDLGGSNSTNVWFQWGTTTSYDNETSHQTMTNIGNFNANIFGLSSNTLYHFRAVAQNNAAIIYGQDLTFITNKGTSNLSPVVNAGSDKQVNEGQSVSLDGSGNDPQGASITFNWTCNGGQVSNQNSPQATFSAPFVSQNTNYTCTLTATNSFGLSGSDSITVLVINTTSNLNTPQVQTLSATSVSTNQATLNGNLSDMGNSGSVNVWFQWGNTTSYGNETSHFTQFNTGNFSSAISNLSPNVTYHFRAVAQNNAGTSFGQDMTFSAGTSGQTNFNVSKRVREINSSNWYQELTVSPSSRLVFEIQVTSNFSAQNVFVKDILPQNMFYQNNLIIDGVHDGRDITQGIDIGNMSQGQTKTITFEAQLAPVSNFGTGTTTLVNTAVAYNSQTSSSSTGTAKVIVNRLSPTNVPTGLTNNFLFDSFVIPLSIALFAVIAFKSKAISLGKWADLRRVRYTDYISEKILTRKIAKERSKGINL